jgi:hypothetical protein
MKVESEVLTPLSFMLPTFKAKQGQGCKRVDAQGNLKKVKLPFELAPMMFMQHWHVRQDIDPGNRWLRNQIATLQTG